MLLRHIYICVYVTIYTWKNVLEFRANCLYFKVITWFCFTLIICIFNWKHIRCVPSFLPLLFILYNFRLVHLISLWAEYCAHEIVGAWRRLVVCPGHGASKRCWIRTQALLNPQPEFLNMTLHLLHFKSHMFSSLCESCCRWFYCVWPTFLISRESRLQGPAQVIRCHVYGMQEACRQVWGSRWWRRGCVLFSVDVRIRGAIC